MDLADQDFTTGSIWRKMVNFSVPVFLINLLQSFYSITDMAVIGHYTGKAGLAAVSNASMLVFIITSISLGFGMGGTVLIAKYKGAKDLQGQRQSSAVLFVCSFFVALALTLASLLFHKLCFEMMDVPAKVMEETCMYMKIFSSGIFFIFGYNTVDAILRGHGDSRNPLNFMVVSTAMNIGLDILLVGGLGTGLKGAAMATVIAQGTAFGLGLRYLRRHELVTSFKSLSYAKTAAKTKAILSVGIPYALQMAIVNISYAVITGMLNSYGVTVAAAAGIGLKISSFAAMPCWAVCGGVTAMTAQNMGAKNNRRVNGILFTGLAANLIITGLLVIMIQIMAGRIIGFFGISGQKFIEAGVFYLRICCSVNSLFYVAMCTLDSFALGVGAAKLALLNSILDSLALRLPLIWLAKKFLISGVGGIYIGQAVSPVIPGLIGFVFFVRGKWIREH